MLFSTGRVKRLPLWGSGCRRDEIPSDGKALVTTSDAPVTSSFLPQVYIGNSGTIQYLMPPWTMAMNALFFGI